MVLSTDAAADRANVVLSADAAAHLANAVLSATTDPATDLANAVLPAATADAAADLAYAVLSTTTADAASHGKRQRLHYLPDAIPSQLRATAAATAEAKVYPAQGQVHAWGKLSTAILSGAE
jgi:hypothetical protein